MVFNITYVFEFDEFPAVEFHLEFDEAAMILSARDENDLPDWARIGFHQCHHCPLDAKTSPWCPAAAGFADIAGGIGSLASYESLVLRVITPDREVRQKTTVSSAVSSLMGLVLATSGCPYTAHFRPMARFHLPLATSEETIYRSASMYLLAQYFRSCRDKATDLELSGLTRIYEDVQAVNKCFANRLKFSGAIKENNAIALLDVYAQIVPVVIDASLEEFAALFEPYMESPG